MPRSEVSNETLGRETGSEFMTGDPPEDEESRLQRFLRAAYDIAINGAPGLGISSAYDLADQYSRGKAPFGKKINSLIRFQDAKAATTGFLTGLGGIITLPVTVPADVSVVLFVQLRMIAAIAIMAGHDPKDDRVRTLCYVCLVGNAAEEILRNPGIIIGKKVAETQLKRMSADILFGINKRVGFRLLTKFGQKGSINLGKMIPLVGGAIGGVTDGVATHLVGKVAKRTFAADEPA
jgi:hypothetical protein